MSKMVQSGEGACRSQNVPVEIPALPPRQAEWHWSRWLRAGYVLALAAASGLAAAELTAPPAYPDTQSLLVVWATDGQQKPVTSRAEWEQRRAHILLAMQQAMGELPGADRRVPLSLDAIEETKVGRVIRRKITFAVEAGDRVPAYLLIPEGATEPRPAVLCLHQTVASGKGEPAGLDGSANLHYGLELAERGYVTLCPDYPNFGDYRIDVYQRGYASASMKGIWNHRCAVDLLESLPEVDGTRIGCIGHSLGGHNALFLAAFEPRIKVAVSSCGFTAFPKYYGGDLTGWSHAGYMPRIASVYGRDPKRMPFDFTEVLAAIAPRAVFINAPRQDGNFEVTGVEDCIRAARPVFELLGAGGRLAALFPDCGHDFPPESRQAAYGFLDQVLAPRR
jgi:dienelactone hydrolase